MNSCTGEAVASDNGGAEQRASTVNTSPSSRLRELQLARKIVTETREFLEARSLDAKLSVADVDRLAQIVVGKMTSGQFSDEDIVRTVAEKFLQIEG